MHIDVRVSMVADWNETRDETETAPPAVPKEWRMCGVLEAEPLDLDA